jgi:hypothetical protein
MSPPSSVARLGLTDDAVLAQPCSPCMDRLNNRPWDRTLAVTVGDVHVGVRANTARTSDRLEELLLPVRNPRKDDVVAPNLSVSVGEEGDSDVRKLALVYRDHQVVARRRDPRRLLFDLVELLDEFARLQVTEAPVVHAVALLDLEDTAMLLPAHAHGGLLTQRPKLEGSQLRMLSSRVHVLDETGTRLSTRIRDAGLGEVAHSLGRETVPDAAIKLWAVPVMADEAFALRPAEGVFGAFTTVITRGTRGPRSTLTMLGSAAEQIRWIGLPALSPAILSRTVAELVD